MMSFTFRNYASLVKIFDCVIVNRWGIVVAEFNSITDEWNGDLPSGNAASARCLFL